ncbi:hypothetical protein [Rhodoferax fermentans]|uniref:hypothetical protein n=1 Tax=Rhodoferax fermentans TaxID=28066 RepID=UPI00117996A8|nr:hypothetical protein [Rhodoferax fermentans]
MWQRLNARLISPWLSAKPPGGKGTGQVAKLFNEVRSDGADGRSGKLDIVSPLKKKVWELWLLCLVNDNYSYLKRKFYLERY